MQNYTNTATNTDTCSTIYKLAIQTAAARKAKPRIHIIYYCKYEYTKIYILYASTYIHIVRAMSRQKNSHHLPHTATTHTHTSLALYISSSIPNRQTRAIIHTLSTYISITEQAYQIRMILNVHTKAVSHLHTYRRLNHSSLVSCILSGYNYKYCILLQYILLHVL